MSQSQHHLPSHAQPAAVFMTPADHGIALPQTPTRPPAQPAPRNISPVVAGSGPVGSAAARLAEEDDATGMPDSGHITLVERWAVGASASQFNALAGAVGGFMSGIVTCPLDVIKTKLQAQGGLHARHQRTVQYKGLVGTAKIIWTQEGIKGMYRGLGPIIMGYLPTWAVWFTVYNKSKVWLHQYYDKPFAVNFWSSIIAGASSTMATNPIWVIKTRLMSQSTSHDRTRYSLHPKGGNTPTSRPTLHQPWHYKSTLDAARKMYTTEGILSFYSGLTPALLGLTHVAVQFPAYEFLKTKFTGRPMGAAPTSGQDAHTADWFGILAASILSKIMASSATYPHEVIRTRLQTQRRPMPGHEYMHGLGGASVTSGSHAAAGDAIAQTAPRYKGIVTTFKTILREEGWRAFYAGMGTNMMRAVPAATVTMLTYEYTMRHLNGYKDSGKRKLELAERKEISER